MLYYRTLISWSDELIFYTYKKIHAQTINLLKLNCFLITKLIAQFVIDRMRRDKIIKANV